MAYMPNYYYPQQIQSGGVIHASEEEARKYPVAPGYSMMFIDDDKKMLYTKTAGFSQLEQPEFVKYRIERENEPIRNDSSNGNKDIPYATKAEFDALYAEFEKIKRRLNSDE